MEDLDRLEELANYIKSASLCGLGQTAPNPVLSTLRNFRDEYIAHIKDKKCPAGVCKKLLSYEIDPEKCMAVLSVQETARQAQSSVRSRKLMSSIRKSA